MNGWEEAFITEQHCCALREKKLARRIRRAKNSGEIEEAQYQYLHSKAAVLLAAIEANNSLAANKHVEGSQLKELAESLDPGVPCKETVIAYPKIKSDGMDFRVIHKFGVRNRSLQMLVRGAVRPVFKPLVAQCEYQKGGVPATIGRIRKAAEAGHCYFARLDIQRFFECFDLAIVQGLTGIPKEIIEAVVIAKEANRTIKTTDKSLSHTTILQRACSGIPLGSVLSPLIAAIFVSNMLMPKHVHLFNWVDDFLLLGMSEEDVQIARDALIDEVKSNSGGKFTLIQKEWGHLSGAAHFLGHQITHDGAQVRITVTERAASELYARLDMYSHRVSVLSEKLPSASLELGKTILNMSVFARSWCNAFRACDDIGEYEVHVMSEVKHLAQSWGISEKEMGGYWNCDHVWNDPYHIKDVAA